MSDKNLYTAAITIKISQIVWINNVYVLLFYFVCVCLCCDF